MVPLLLFFRFLDWTSMAWPLTGQLFVPKTKFTTQVLRVLDKCYVAIRWGRADTSMLAKFYQTFCTEVVTSLLHKFFQQWSDCFSSSFVKHRKSHWHTHTDIHFDLFDLRVWWKGCRTGLFENRSSTGLDRRRR